MSSTTYPVRVEASLQEPLSRWLWLLKWMLVIPHYIVLAFLWMAFVVLSVVAAFAILFTGHYPRGIFDFNVGVLRWSWRVGYYSYSGLGTDRYPPFTLAERRTVNEHYPMLWQGGLIGILVLVAAVVLLFTGRYPRTIFDLVLGLNRWVLRVAAYAGLMTDEYPPFRLDAGAAEPGGPDLHLSPGSGPPSGPTSGRSGGSWGVGRVVGAVLGSLLVLTSFGLLAGGGAVKVADSAARDTHGYLMSDTVRYSSPGYAATSEPVTFGFTRWRSWPQRWIGTVKVTLDARTANGAFVGLAPTSAVERYLHGVARTRMSFAGDRLVSHQFTDGISPRNAPTDEHFWVASTSGRGHRTLTWQPRTGDWTLVVMNGEGTTPVSAGVAVGATMPALDNLALGLLVSGGVLLVCGAGVLTAVLVRRRS